MSKKEIGIISIENLYFGYFKAAIAGRSEPLTAKTLKEYSKQSILAVAQHKEAFPK